MVVVDYVGVRVIESVVAMRMGVGLVVRPILVPMAVGRPTT